MMRNRTQQIPRRTFLAGCATALAAGCISAPRREVRPSAPSNLIGYSEYRTNLPGGRHANIATMRACIVRAAGTGRVLLGSELAATPDTWTQFVGWSPDGGTAIIGCGWESPENAAWEEEHQTFRMTEGWLYDCYLFDLASNQLTNVTAVDRVSAYSTGVRFWPGDAGKLGFEALIDGVSHPFRMDLDGRNKTDLTKDSKSFTYGSSTSPDGRRIAYHRDYQIVVANADGSDATPIDTGNPFNFGPRWSPDGQWLLFVSGEHYDCHPYIVRADGSDLHRLASRNGYKGAIDILDVPDFHAGSSDVPVWSADGAWVFYTAKAGENVELMRVSIDGRVEQLTHCTPGARNYHPTVSQDGRWLAFGSDRTGTRQLYVMPAEGGDAWPITDVAPGHGAMWASWQPDSEAR